jgi:hypothetical protein
LLGRSSAWTRKKLKADLAATSRQVSEVSDDDHEFDVF